ncbi:MAG: UDP-glucose/GDP-mannose dehydrogenase family protein [Chloroflexota bacterium]
MATIAVIGTGYVGLTAGACLASMGHTVTCVDIDEAKINQLRKGGLPIVEQGLEELLHEGLATGRLAFTIDLAAAVADCAFVFLCLPTPSRADGSADISYVVEAAREMGGMLPPGAIVVNKSTLPIGSTLRVAAALQRSDVHVVSNPEFLREGTAVEDFFHPDRIVIGSIDREAGQKVAALYGEITARVIITDPASAEMIKYASNAFLATKISFINAVAAICEQVGADVQDVAAGMGADPRIGAQFLAAGPGWGGSCFPKDAQAFVTIAADAGNDFHLLKSAIQTNEEQIDRVVAKVAAAVGGRLAGATIAVWGLTFKAGTDDLRHSPALKVCARLHEAGVARIQVFDPTVTAARAGIPPYLHIASGALEATHAADVLLVLTEWSEFREIEPSTVHAQMRQASVVDTRNHLDRDLWRRSGATYQGAGR